MSLAIPEMVGGERRWTDVGVSDIVHKLHHGDPTIGWEGDERLSLCWCEVPWLDERTGSIAPGWELWRLEDDGVMRRVMRTHRDLDERVLWKLCEWDRNRRSATQLHDEIIRANERLDAERMAHHVSYINEEAAPRLAYALKKEGGW